MKTAASSTAALLQRHKHLWGVVTRNPFVDGIREGTLPRRLFDRWLMQDRHYLDALFATVARILAGAPPGERKDLVEVLASTHRVIEWLEEVRKTRRLRAVHEIHPICRAYADHVTALSFAPFPVTATALWAQDRAFFDAWRSARPGGDGYRSIVAAWTSKAVVDRCGKLRAIANRALRRAGEAERRAAEQGFEQVVRYELDFWVMALEPD